MLSTCIQVPYPIYRYTCIYFYCVEFTWYLYCRRGERTRAKIICDQGFTFHTFHKKQLIFFGYFYICWIMAKLKARQNENPFHQ